MNTDDRPPEQPQRGRLVLPDSLLTVESIPDAIDAYLAAGLRPILIHYPIDGGLCTCGKKHDRTKSGSSSAGKHPVANNWQKQPADRDVIIDQLARLKFTPNLGVALGTQPIGGYIVAVDVDDDVRFKAIEVELGSLPETAGSTSGRGRHLFYEIPAEIDLTRLINVTGLGGEPGVDVKREGGQVVVAPSLHNSGKRYAWVRVGPIATLPMQWALELVKAPDVPAWVGEFTPQTMNSDRKARNRAEKYLERAVIGEASALARCGEGMRNNTLYRSAFKMFGYCASLYLGGRWQYVHDQLLGAARSAGLDEREARRTLESADKSIREKPDFRLPVVFQNRADAPSSAVGEPPSPSAAGELEHIPSPADSDYHEHIAPSGRPIIKVTTELHENVAEAVTALCADPDIYQREKRLVTVARVSREQIEAAKISTDGGETFHHLVEGTPQICELTRPVIKGCLSKVAVFHKWIKKESCYGLVLPPDDIVAHIHDQESWDGIRPIVSIIETPTMRPDGTIVQLEKTEDLYDPVTRYLYSPSESFKLVQDQDCTQANAQYYLNLLSEVFEDFPYVNASHRMVPIAAILTLIARPAILGSVPAFLFDASTRGSGKTLQTDAIAIVSTGRGAPRMNYTSDEVELEKILGGYAIKGSSFICLDNVPSGRAFGGGPLDRVLTARDTVDLRVLGRSSVPTLKWRAVVMATGNNMTLYSDTARRALMARLEPTDENPERRTKFKHKDLLAWVRTNRARLVSGALLILRAYWRAGRPDMGCHWGSFEEWSHLIPSAIVFAGGADPMKARPESDKDVDPEAQAMAGVIEQLPLLIEKVKEFESEPGKLSQRMSIAARSIIDCLYGQKPEWSEFSPLKEAVEILCRPRGGRGPSTPDAISLGYKLRSMRSRVIDGRKLVCEPDGNHVMMWHVKKLE